MSLKDLQKFSFVYCIKEISFYLLFTTITVQSGPASGVRTPKEYHAEMYISHSVIKLSLNVFEIFISYLSFLPHSQESFLPL